MCPCKPDKSISLPICGVSHLACAGQPSRVCGSAISRLRGQPSRVCGVSRLSDRSFASYRNVNKDTVVLRAISLTRVRLSPGRFDPCIIQRRRVIRSRCRRKFGPRFTAVSTWRRAPTCSGVLRRIVGDVRPCVPDRPLLDSDWVRAEFTWMIVIAVNPHLCACVSACHSVCLMIIGQPLG